MPQPHLEDGSTYRAVRPTRQDSNSNFCKIGFSLRPTPVIIGWRTTPTRTTDALTVISRGTSISPQVTVFKAGRPSSSSWKRSSNQEHWLRDVTGMSPLCAVELCVRTGRLIPAC